MLLIKKLSPRKNKKGHINSYGLFFCPYCLQEVERRLDAGIKAKSCGCVSGKLTSETRIKLLTNKENHPFFGKNLSEKHKQKIKENHADVFGENNSFYGKKHTNESRQKIKENHADVSYNKNSQWQGGKSFESYGVEFKQIRKFILERDNYKCQNPECKINIGYYKRLDCHHIDYDKKNNAFYNLIILCINCHLKTNGKKKRQYYKEFYQNINMGILK